MMEGILIHWRNATLQSKTSCFT